MVIEALQVTQDLAIVLIIAVALSLIAHWIRQPLIVGYLVAGIVIGPYTPPGDYLTHPEVLNLFAEIGIVFLLFAIGLEYPLSRLRSVGRSALVIAVAESLGTFALIALLGRAIGFGEYDSLFLGLAASVTSTLILSKVLEEMGVLQSGSAGLVIGITIVEDVVIITALGLLQSLAKTGGFSIVAVGIGLALVVGFVAVALLAGTRAIPWALDQVERLHRPDLLLLALLGIAFGFAVLANEIGISVATGAFLAGVTVAESRTQGVARGLVAPLKELFGAMFFVSMGALMNISLIPSYLGPIVAVLATAMVAKFVLTYGAARVRGVARRAAIRTGVGIAGPGGEVSLTVVKGGADLAVLSPFVLPIVGSITLLTAVFSAARVRWAWRNRASDPAD